MPASSLCRSLVVGACIGAGAGAWAAATLDTGLFDTTQVQRGGAAYAARCASCHAADLRGNSNTPSLLGASFLFLWEGRMLGELYTKLRTEMPQDQPGSLTAETYLDLLGYLLNANGYPAGPQPLTDNQAVLDGIVITAPLAQ